MTKWMSSSLLVSIFCLCWHFCSTVVFHFLKSLFLQINLPNSEMISSTWCPYIAEWQSWPTGAWENSQVLRVFPRIDIHRMKLEPLAEIVVLFLYELMTRKYVGTWCQRCPLVTMNHEQHHGVCRHDGSRKRWKSRRRYKNYLRTSLTINYA